MLGLAERAPKHVRVAETAPFNPTIKPLLPFTRATVAIAFACDGRGSDLITALRFYMGRVSWAARTVPKCQIGRLLQKI